MADFFRNVRLLNDTFPGPVFCVRHGSVTRNQIRSKIQITRLIDLVSQVVVINLRITRTGPGKAVLYDIRSKDIIICSAGMQKMELLPVSTWPG